MIRKFPLNIALGVSLLSFLLAQNLFAQETDNPEKGQLQSGKVIGQHIFGLAHDVSGDPLLVDDSALIYPNPLATFEVDIKEQVFQVSLFDHLFGGAYLSRLDDGLTVNTQAIDFGDVNGVSSIGAATKTEWSSVLFTEHQLIDAKSSDHKSLYVDYFKGQSDLHKPYNYGWLNEIVVLDEYGTNKAIKNFVAGRLFASHLLAMSGGQEFYFFDARYSGNLYLFKADQPQSFAKGTLYVVDDRGVSTELGQSSALKMKFKLKKTEFSDVFEVDEPLNKQCSKGMTFIRTVYGEECLSVLKKNRKYAGQFEPIRSSALLGISPFFKSTNVDDTQALELRYDSNKTAIQLYKNGQLEKQVIIESAGSEQS
ncbi:hypothetical protein A3715_02105 [Oleiphilus sp. HI0009]|nr:MULTISPECIES: hypothetical protein [unclassified Oleiphilus]KZX76173.1 hypothetical protein A3715_02105 [Oleiphilus sp. HI0009]KZY67591.1 hypothetical protein A3739_12395 [Oleiphilus sp. HI0067]KZY71877.1 hypothetical protein A3738_14435 [Oleiphilus sp. HI0066]KZZ59596.1 hypothetical protein A3762_04695 [Oleiphilus sp. HI0125]